VSIDQVRSHFGFSKMPFGKDLSPSALHRHHGHLEAVARISFLVSEQAIGVVTGEVGSGKTVAARAAVAELEPSRHTLVYLPNPAIGARGLYAEIVAHLGGKPCFYKSALISQATSLLAVETTERGRRVLLIVDEAHLLDPGQLEELRLLTNLDLDSASPFALLLLGQPSLRSRLRLGSFAALDQRVTLRYTIPPMTPEETASYVTHHLKLCGRTDTLFSDDALARIHQAGRGLPRAVNNLARQALVAAFANRSAIADEKAARQAISETDAE
jgi:type II secretory pathway predicted ATPase ExeA